MNNKTPFDALRGFQIALAILLTSCAGVHHRTLSSHSDYSPDVSAVTLLKTGRTATGERIPYPRTTHPEVTALYVTIPPGKETGWHKHTCPGYAYIIEGELVVRCEDGTEHKYHAGDAFAEMVQRAHNGQNRGHKPVRLVAFFTGEEKKPITEKTR